MVLAASFVYGTFIDEVITIRRAAAPPFRNDSCSFDDDHFSVTCLTISAGNVGGDLTNSESFNREDLGVGGRTAQGTGG
jgi:hypothetical protein